MGQLLFRRSFSVGTKLLLSVLLLIAIVIGFLNVSAIILLKEDKQAYVFQSKLTEAVLAGSEFVNTARHVLDTLRLSAAAADPRKPVTPQHRAALNSVVENQSDVVFIAVSLVEFADPAAPSMKVIAQGYKAKKLEELSNKPEDFTINQEWLKSVIPDLKQNGYAFINFSKSGGSPYLGVLIADAPTDDTMAVAYGAVPLRRFGSELSALSLTIASKSGWVLFDTDPTVLFSRTSIINDPLFVFSTKNPTGNGTHEYQSNGVRYLGSYVYPGFELVALTRVEFDKAHQATYALTEKFILLGMIAVGAGILFAIFFSKTLTAPIAKLYAATKEVGSGHFNLNLEISSNDEIGELTRSFNSMSQKINELFIESVEKVKLENELDIASTVQQNLLPPPVYMGDKVEIHSYYHAASRCGGDWWGTFTVGNKVCVGIADATGHGLPCALITASAKSCFSLLHKLAEEDPNFKLDPAAMLSIANRGIFEATEGRIMMTFFMAVLDFEKGVVRYANAGHNPPWLFRDEGGKIVLKSLTAAGQRLGESRDLPAIEEKSMAISQGDMILLYTDGLMEGRGSSGEMYGKRRMRSMVESNFARGPRAIVDGLVGDFRKYSTGVAQEDDVTIATVKIVAAPGGAPAPAPGMGAETGLVVAPA